MCVTIAGVCLIEWIHEQHMHWNAYMSIVHRCM